MIETTIYKCEYCGAEFDDEYKANCHEWVCRYNDVKKQDGSCLGFYREDGTEIKFDNARFVYTELEDIAALTVGNETDVQFAIDIFDWYGISNLFGNSKTNNVEKLFGLWYFDENSYDGELVRVDDQIKKWVDIENKFIKDA